MFGITRSIFRWGLVAGIGLGGLTLLVGPHRVGAAFDQFRSKAGNFMDSCIDDPIALRRQFSSLPISIRSGWAGPWRSCGS